MSNPRASASRTTAAVAGAVLALAAADAWAGPCTSDIAQFEAAIRASQGNPSAGLTAPQSVGADLSHQPTPASVKQAQEPAEENLRGDDGPRQAL